jgi:hypothetical protein
LAERPCRFESGPGYLDSDGLLVPAFLVDLLNSPALYSVGLTGLARGSESLLALAMLSDGFRGPFAQ